MKTISLNNVVKNYSRTEISGGVWNYFKSLFKRNKSSISAISNVSLEINSGEIVGLVGENGAGKSTLIKLMDGILIPTSGQISVLGFSPFEKKKKFLRQIGVVMGQKAQLWWDLSPRETFLLFKSIYGLTTSEFENSLSKLVQALNIKKVIDSPTRNLSLGERMKCELVCALIHRPKILFLDEPTIGLDFVAQKDIHKFLLEYREEQETTIILTSHYMSDIEALSDRIMVLSDGIKVYDNCFKDLKRLTNQYSYLEVQLNNQYPMLDLVEDKVVNKGNYSILLKVAPASVEKYITLLQKQNNVRGYTLREMPIQDLLVQLYFNGGKNDD